MSYDGTKADAKTNPIYSLLMTYENMSKNDILTHIRDWWFDADPEKIFFDSVKSEFIVEVNGKWKLNNKEISKEEKDMADIQVASKVYEKYGGTDADLEMLAHNISRWLDWDFQRALNALEKVRKSKLL